MKPRRKLLSPEPVLEPRPCDVRGCATEALYRAPADREHLRESRWFCLEHARAYNLKWDFFAGMSQAEIEAFQKRDVIGHRPTWPFGLGSIGMGPLQDALKERIHEAFARTGAFARAGVKRGAPPPSPARKKALARLKLEPGCTRDEIKQRYKELVKRYHPDLNGGDRGGEEQLRAVTDAYRYLMNRSGS